MDTFSTGKTCHSKLAHLTSCLAVSLPEGGQQSGSWLTYQGPRQTWCRWTNGCGTAWPCHWARAKSCSCAWSSRKSSLLEWSGWDGQGWTFPSHRLSHQWTLLCVTWYPGPWYKSHWAGAQDDWLTSQGVGQLQLQIDSTRMSRRLQIGLLGILFTDFWHDLCSTPGGGKHCDSTTNNFPQMVIHTGHM